MKTYSIIIPHKNVPYLLSRCMDSIPQREDIEIIIVDDNSDIDNWDPNVFSFLNRPDTKMIFTKEGKGAGYARNVGLRSATGKWLLFADADDFYTDGFLDVLDKYKNSELDILYFCINDDTQEVRQINKVISCYLEHPAIEEDYIRLTYWNPWNKMFCRNFIMSHNILFDEIYAANDAMFVVKAGYYAKRIDANLSPLYNYMLNPNSLTQFKCLKRDISLFDLYIRMNQFYRSVGKNRFVFDLYIICMETWNKKDYKLFFNYIGLILKHKQFGYFIYSFLYNSAKRMKSVLKRYCFSWL